ncbi:hypothetical protein ACH5RR_040221 [Cinchona calisaya]|uniref:Zinc finger protein n=1 Tax=Cinchona calisaya TaxID=153742 RepID=A0ABD2XRM4_9GENT
MDISSSSQQQQQQQQQFQTFQFQAYDHPSQIQTHYYPSQFRDYSSFATTQYVNGYEHHQQQQHQHSQPEMPPQPAQGPVMASGQVVDQQNGYYVVVPCPNPVAAAALAVLAQISGALGGFQGRYVVAGPSMVSGPGLVMRPEPGYYGPRPMHPLAGCPQYGGVGSFRVGNHMPTGCSFQGVGGSNQFQQHSVLSSHSDPSTAAEKIESKGGVAEPLTSTAHEGAKAHVLPPQAPAPPNGNVTRQPARGARCELCKVDCTTLEKLEQHKNGKRHKKNLQRSQLLENASKSGAETCKEKIPVGDSNLDFSLKTKNITEGVENKQSQPGTFATKVIGDENKMEIQQANDKAELHNSSGNPKSDSLASLPGNQMHDLKRKMNDGSGGKRLKTFDSPKVSLKPPKPNILTPFICNLCNVRCDSKVAFDRHLSGKKHISKTKRFEAHQAMYGQLGLQAQYPPSSVAQNLFHQQGHQQTIYRPQSPYPPLGTGMPPPTYNAVPAATGTVSESVQYPSPQMSNDSPQFRLANALSDTQRQVVLLEPEPKQ